MAAEFFEQQDQAEQIRTEAQERVDEVLVTAEQDAEAAVRDAGAKVRQILDTGRPTPRSRPAWESAQRK